MSKRILWALLLLAGTALVLVTTKGSTSVSLVLRTVTASTPLILLVFTGVGVVIGLLLK